ncbi:MAG TPA: hypothetical protein VF733_01170 [Candidatus Saccharimonadales bacterium]
MVHSSKRNKVIALIVVGLALIVGFWVFMSRAASFFVSITPESSTLSGNAKLVSEADGSKALQFNAPVTPPPTTPPTTPPTNGEQTCPPYPAFPDKNCTGAPDENKLPIVNGDVTLSAAGMVYEGKHVKGTIYVRANNITIKRTWVDGGIQIRGWEGVKGLVVEDATIGYGYGDDGIAFSDYTCRRCDISGFSDGAKINGNVLIEDSWIHNLNIRPNDHADGLQNNNGSGNVTIRHSSIDGGNNAAIFIADTPSGTMLIENNYMYGGNYTLQLLDNAGYAATVRGNYIARDSYAFGPHRLHQDPAKVIWENNYLVDDDASYDGVNLTNKTLLAR